MASGIRRIGFVTAVLLGLASAASADTLRVGGIGAATAFLPELFAAFEPNGPAKLKIIPSLGSSGGLRALEDGLLDIAVTGRPLTADELKRGLTPAVTIRTPFILVTSHRNPDGFKSDDIPRLYKSPQATWSDGTPIRIILRPKSDSDTPALTAMLPGMAAAVDEARRRPDVPIAATDQDNASLAERVPGSLASSTLTQIKAEARNLRIIAVDGVVPSIETFRSGAYRFGKTLAFVLPAQKSPAAERFIAFLQSPAGQTALHATSNLLVD